MPFLYISLILFIIWCLFLVFSKETRKEQLVVSIFGFILAPGMILLAVGNDFRKTFQLESGTIGIEDLLFAFSVAGIAAVIYQVAFGRHVHKIPKKRWRLHPNPMHWLANLIAILGLWALISLSLLLLFGINSVYALIVAGLMIGIYMIADRHDLLMNAIFSGLFMGVLIFFLEYLFFARIFPGASAEFWHWESLSGIHTGSIPLEELLWALTVGFTLGPLYEYVRQWRLK